MPESHQNVSEIVVSALTVGFCVLEIDSDHADLWEASHQLDWYDGTLQIHFVGWMAMRSGHWNLNILYNILVDLPEYIAPLTEYNYQCSETSNQMSRNKTVYVRQLLVVHPV